MTGETTIERAGVVGFGQMGSGIVEVLARSGVDVVVVDADQAAVERGERLLRASLSAAVQREKLDAVSEAATLERVRMTLDFDQLGDRDLIIEATAENLSIKREVFARLDGIAPPKAILASNTSSISIASLGSATQSADRVAGLHFFNPAPVMKLVEVIPSVRTSSATVETLTSFARDRLGKTVVFAADRAGFIVNTLLAPYLLSAVRLFDSGQATAADIDQAMKLGTGVPMGPLELIDLVGADIVKQVGDSMFSEFKEPHFAPPPLLLRMVEAGWLGRKSGRGFYEYD